MKKFTYIMIIIGVSLLFSCNKEEFNYDVYVTIPFESVVETGRTVTYVELSLNPAPFDIQLSVNVSGNATAGVDFEPLPESITIPAGYSSYLLPVVILDDTDLESDERIDIRFSATDGTPKNVVLRSAEFELIIQDNDISLYLEWDNPSIDMLFQLGRVVDDVVVYPFGWSNGVTDDPVYQEVKLSGNIPDGTYVVFLFILKPVESNSPVNFSLNLQQSRRPEETISVSGNIPDPSQYSGAVPLVFLKSGSFFYQL